MENKTNKIVKVYGSIHLHNELINNQNILDSVTVSKHYIDSKRDKLDDISIAKHDRNEGFVTDVIILFKEFVINSLDTKAVNKLFNDILYFQSKDINVSVLVDLSKLNEYIVIENISKRLIDHLADNGVINVICYKSTDDRILSSKTLELINEVVGKDIFSTRRDLYKFYGLSNSTRGDDSFEKHASKDSIEDDLFKELNPKSLDSIIDIKDLVAELEEITADTLNAPANEESSEMTLDEVQAALNEAEENLKDLRKENIEASSEEDYVPEELYIPEYENSYMISEENMTTLIEILSSKKKSIYKKIDKLNDFDKKELANEIKRFNDIKGYKTDDVDNMQLYIEELVALNVIMENYLLSRNEYASDKNNIEIDNKKQKTVIQSSNNTKNNKHSQKHKPKGSVGKVKVNSQPQASTLKVETVNDVSTPNSSQKKGNNVIMTPGMIDIINTKLFDVANVKKDDKITFHVFDRDNFSKDIPIAQNILNRLSGVPRTSNPEDVLIVNLSSSNEVRVSLNTIDSIFFSASDENDIKELLSQAIIKDRYRPHILVMQNYMKLKSEVVGGILPHLPKKYTEIHVIMNFDEFKDAIREFQHGEIGDTKVYLNSNFEKSQEFYTKFSKTIANASSVMLDEESMFSKK